MNSPRDPALSLDELGPRVQVRILVSRRARIDDNWNLDLRSPYWRLYVNNQSGAFLEQDGEVFSMEGGETWLIPAWVRFRTGVKGIVIQDYLHFEVGGLPVRAVQRLFPGVLRCHSSGTLRALVQRWQKAIEAPEDCSHFQWAAALIHAALAGYFVRLTPQEFADGLSGLREPVELRPAFEAIRKNLDNPPKVGALARACGLSEDHFGRRFRQLTGLSPAEYGRQHRLLMAAEWLTGTHRTVEDIAASTGFGDRFHFSKAFRALLGLPPVEYRRMHRREEAMGGWEL